MTRFSPATFRTFFACALGACLLAGASSACAATAKLPSRLVVLARKAKNKRNWPALLRYAHSRIPKKDRGWALFVLGYREFEAAKYALAEKNLVAAAKTRFPFPDLAIYYAASAAYKSDAPARTLILLQSFSERYPKSTAYEDAEELRAWAYLKIEKPEEAIRVLTAMPAVRERPKLALLLGRADREAGRLMDAAAAYQGVYYAFPATSQAEAAAHALADLKATLGSRYPRVSDRIATARAEKLAKSGYCSQAIQAYGRLLKERRDSAFAWQWNIGRARCLNRTGKANQAIETLIRATPASSATDAERLEVLTESYIRKKDDNSIASMLKQMEAAHSASSQYARALWLVADYYMDKPDLAMAATLFHTLASDFPGTADGAAGSWGASLLDYLQGKRDAARTDFQKLISRYPDSPRVPAALYFLGRIEERTGAWSGAREYFHMLRKHFVHNYYAVEAERRLHGVAAEARAHQGRERKQNAESIREIASLLPRRADAGLSACDPASDAALLVPYFDLHRLGLDDLARKTASSFTSRERRTTGFLINLSKLDAEAGRPDLAIRRAKQVSPEYERYRFDELPANIWGLLYPRSYWRIVRARAAANRLDPYLVMAVVRQESGFYPRATSPADARGLMQILPSTASSRRSRRITRRLYEPSFNVRLGCMYLRELLKRYKGNLAAALAAYNAGPSRADAWLARFPSRSPEEFIETIPFPGTRVYVKAVFRDAAMYRMMLTGSAKYQTCRSRSSRRSSRQGRISH